MKPVRRMVLRTAREIASTVCLATCLTVAGCAEPGEGDSRHQHGNGDNSPGRGEAARDLVHAVAVDLNSYWGVAAQELGFEYAPVPLARITDGRNGALCDSEPVTVDEAEGDAFVDAHCAEGLMVVYDAVYVNRSLARLEATMAHEWGHVVQAQAEELDISFDEEGLPIDAELQADCFAGAWAKRRAYASMAALRRDVAAAGDADGIEVDDPQAHGTAQERQTAFDVGARGGPRACIDELRDSLPG